MPVQQVRSTAAASTKPAALSAADLKTATKLKHAISEQLKVVRFGNALPIAEQPKANAKGEWKAPNGDRLIRVQLSAPPPPGSADMMSSSAYVDPKTNKFYVGNFGGIAGMRMFHGPLSLPAGTQFKGKNFSAADIDALTASANVGGQGAQTIPTKAQMLNALGANEFHHLVKWSNKAPKDGEILKKVELQKVQHPDGYAYTGLVLKSDPKKVIIVRTGGFAGMTQYSQPLDTTRLPK